MQRRRAPDVKAWLYQCRRHPDGAWVLFVSDRDGAETLWLMDVESQGVTRQRSLFDADTWPREAC